MKFRSTLAALAVIGAGPTIAQDLKRVAIPNQYIVKLKNEVSSLESFAGISDIRGKKIGKGVALVSSSLPLRENSLVESTDENVEWVAPNYMYIGNFMESANDPLLSRQYHIPMIGAEQVWDEVARRGEEVVVAVTDNGYDLEHEDMVGSFWKNENEIPDNGIDDDQNGYIDDYDSWDFNEDDNDPNDSSGSHGAHVAGIISAQLNNGIGIAPVAPNIKTMPLKFYGNNPWTSAMILETYSYAVDNGAKIISTSYNIDYKTGDRVYQEALDYAEANNVLVFNSAGNGSKRDSKRSQLSNVILIASVVSGDTPSDRDKKSRFSNYGYAIDYSAPGNPIHSHLPRSRYGDMSGTSMATPVAAAVAATIWSVYPEYTKEQVLSRMALMSKNVTAKNEWYRFDLGYGRVSFDGLFEELPAVEYLGYKVLDKLNQIHLRFNTPIVSKNLNQDSVEVRKLSTTGSSKSVNFSIKPTHFAQNAVILDIEGENTSGNFEIVIKSDDFVDPFGRSISKK